MFDLEQSISEWRKQLLAAGVKNPLPLEELENHLRDDINHLCAAGETGEEAFRIAAARVGKPRVVAAEFNKAKSGWPRPMIIGSLIWALMAISFLAFLASRYANGKLSLLLVAHIFTVAIGYCTVFLAGALGIYHVLGRRFQMAGTITLARAMSLSIQLSAVLVVVGFLTGMVWSSRNLGHVWTNDPREIGGLSVIVWLAVPCLIQSTGRLGIRRMVQFGIIGNMVVALAWFGAGAVHRGYGIASFWPLDVFLGVHLCLLGMTIPRNESLMEI